MPGIFGFTHADANATTHHILEQMALALKDESFYQLHQHNEENISFGRIGLAFQEPETQPAWNENHSMAIVMEGEIYNYDEHYAYLEKKGHQIRSNAHSELLIHYYEEHGMSFLNKINGAFAIAIWDRPQDKLILANDHLGLQPLYYNNEHGKDIIFGSGVRAILSHPSLSRELDFLAFAELLTFDHVLNDRTLVKNVKLLPGGSILTFSNGNYHIERYWLPQYPKYYPIRSEDDYREELRHLLRKAVTRQTPGEQTAAILMSGGLDSRIIAALLHDQTTSTSIQTFTMGQPNCDDERFAREVSSKLGMSHDFFQLNGDFLIDFAEKGVRLTDGMGNIVHMHTLPNLKNQAQKAQLIYKGFLGDALIGYGITNFLWANFNETTLPQAHLAVHRNQGLLVFKPKELDQLLLPLNENLSSKVVEEYSQAMLDSGIELPADQRNHFDLCQRVPRMTLNGVTWVRSQAHVRLPFADKDLVEFMLTVPPGFRNNRKIIKDLFIEDYPELAKIPYTETNYPMIHCLRRSFMRIDEQLRWWLRNKGLRWIKEVQKSHYALYNEWMRNELKDWVQDILLSKRFIERGYFNPAYVNNIIQAHMQGENHNKRLGALISLELWHRLYLDG